MLLTAGWPQRTYGGRRDVLKQAGIHQICDPWLRKICSRHPAIEPEPGKQPLLALLAVASKFQPHHWLAPLLNQGAVGTNPGNMPVTYGCRLPFLPLWFLLHP